MAGGAGEGDGGGALAGALSRALCFIHKLQRPGAAAAAAPAPAAARQAPKPRVLVLGGCLDVTAQYIAVMNAIFSALARAAPPLPAKTAQLVDSMWLVVQACLWLACTTLPDFWAPSR